jgi:hypothetical protein
LSTGSARGIDSAVIPTIGTGSGGGILDRGRLVRGRYGFAAEMGHLGIKADGRRCSCGLRGRWERYGSGTALVHEARELAAVAPANARRTLELAGGDVQGIDPTALEIGPPGAPRAPDPAGNGAETVAQRRRWRPMSGALVCHRNRAARCPDQWRPEWAHATHDQGRHEGLRPFRGVVRTGHSIVVGRDLRRLSRLPRP